MDFKDRLEEAPSELVRQKLLAELLENNSVEHVLARNEIMGKNDPLNVYVTRVNKMNGFSKPIFNVPLKVLKKLREYTSAKVEYGGYLHCDSSNTVSSVEVFEGDETSVTVPGIKAGIHWHTHPTSAFFNEMNFLSFRLFPSPSDIAQVVYKSFALNDRFLNIIITHEGIFIVTPNYKLIREQGVVDKESFEKIYLDSVQVGKFTLHNGIYKKVNRLVTNAHTNVIEHSGGPTEELLANPPIKEADIQTDRLCDELAPLGIDMVFVKWEIIENKSIIKF